MMSRQAGAISSTRVTASTSERQAEARGGNPLVVPVTLHQIQARQDTLVPGSIVQDPAVSLSLSPERARPFAGRTVPRASTRAEPRGASWVSV